MISLSWKGHKFYPLATDVGKSDRQNDGASLRRPFLEMVVAAKKQVSEEDWPWKGVS